MTNQHTTDLNDPDSPEKIPDVLRRAAEKMREQASELQSAWQDAEAGAVWNKVAEELDRCADRVRKVVSSA